MKPKDLGVKIASKEEQAWTEIMTRAEREIEQNLRIVEIDRMIVLLAQKKVEEEKKKVLNT